MTEYCERCGDRVYNVVRVLRMDPDEDGVMKPSITEKDWRECRTCGVQWDPTFLPDAVVHKFQGGNGKRTPKSL